MEELRTACDLSLTIGASDARARSSCACVVPCAFAFPCARNVSISRTHAHALRNAFVLRAGDSSAFSAAFTCVCSWATFAASAKKMVHKKTRKS